MDASVLTAEQVMAWLGEVPDPEIPVISVVDLGIVRAVDVAGGQVLANVCAAMKYRGTVAACGLAAGMALPATVAPFILRGVTLAGIDSVMCPRAERLEAWRRLAIDLDPGALDALTREIALAEVIPAADLLMAGRIRGRILVPLGLDAA